MKRKIFNSTGMLVILSLLLSYLFIIGVMYRQYFTGMEQEVEREASYIRAAVDLAGEDYLKEDFVKDGNNRITLIGTDGTVLYDSSQKAEELDSHKNRPEVEEAMKDGQGEIVRFSDTLGEQTFYYALRLDNGMVIRVANTTDSVFAMVMSCIPLLILLAAGVLFVVMLLAKWQTRYIIGPLNNLNLEQPLENDVYEELTPLLHRIEKQNRLIAEQMSDLNKRQEELNAITRNMREGLIIINKKAVILSINKAAQELLQVSREECIKKHILNINRNESLQNAVETALLGKAESEDLELNGRSYRIIANPVYTDEEISGCVVLILDVTEKKRGEQMRKEFTANVSHELKTPLMSISGYAEIMKNGLVKPADIPEFSGRIYSEANRLSHLVEDIMKLSRLDEDSTLPEYEDVNLLMLSEDIKARLLPQAEKKKIEAKVIGENVKIHGVRQILDEMVYNLFDNAIKYTPDGGKAGISVIREGDTVLLTVWDTGIGIPKEYQERIFERFFRVDKSHSRESGGTGLGLSIVKHGAMFHKADIKIDSETGRGTKIMIRFAAV